MLQGHDERQRLVPQKPYTGAIKGIVEASTTTGVPIAFGVLTTLTEEQALARSVPGPENKGREAALAAIEMATLIRQLEQEIVE